MLRIHSSFSSTVRWIARRGCSSSVVGSTWTFACCATTAADMAARFPTTARSRWMRRSAISSRFSPIVRPCWSDTVMAATLRLLPPKPQEAAEMFMRRMIGNRRWEALPDGTRETRRAEGVAMVEELADLRRHQPWFAEHITMPVVTSYGSLGAPHHQEGMRYAASLLDCPFVELADCRHDAPLSHPDLFRSEVIEPLLQRVGPPWWT